MYSAARRSYPEPLPRPCIASLARKPSSARIFLSSVTVAVVSFCARDAHGVNAMKKEIQKIPTRRSLISCSDHIDLSTLWLHFYYRTGASGFVNRRNDRQVSATHLTGHWSLTSSQNTFREIVHLSSLLINPGKVQRAFAGLAHASAVTKCTSIHLKPALASVSSKVIALAIKARRAFA